MLDHDPALAAAHAAGALDPEDRARFEAHLASGCPACAADFARAGESLAAFASLQPAPAPAIRMRSQLLELAVAPRLPLDTSRYTWVEPVPGIRLHVVKEEPERSFRSVLVWADPGARHPRHRHHGEEVILVMEGGLRDFRGDYRAGDICRSATGSVHAEEVLPLGTCFCFVLYYGDLEMLGE